MPALGAYETLRVLVTVKAYPSLSSRYGEAICVAGVRLDTPEPEWVRLFPVRFRDLPREQQFSKYEVITVRACRHSTDTRRETWRPDLDSIERHEFLSAGGTWPKRRAVVEPLIGPTMCELHRGRKGGADGPSLGLVRPARMRGIPTRAEDEWTVGQAALAGQGNLLTVKTDLEKPLHAFSYSYCCEEPGCKGHTQKIVDWELGQAYRSWERSPGELVASIQEKWLDFMFDPKRDTTFFVGDQHTRPGQFLVLGTFYPEREQPETQLTMDVLA